MFETIDRLLEQRWVRLLGLGLSVVGVGFLAWGVVEAWGSIEDAIASLRWPQLAVSLLGLLAMYAGMSASTALLLRELGSRVPASAAFAVVMLANLSKHIPGGVWQVGAHLERFRRLGVGSHVASVAWAMNAMTAAGGAVLVGSGLWLGFGGDGPRWVTVAAVVALPMAAGLLVPAVRWWIVRRAGRLFVDPSTGAAASVSVSALVMGLGFAVHGGALVLGLGLDVPVGAAAAAFALAWAAGFLFVISPGGLGAREAALVVLLGAWLAPAEIAVAAVFSRIIFLVADAAGAAIAAPFGRKVPDEGHA